MRFVLNSDSVVENCCNWIADNYSDECDLEVIIQSIDEKRSGKQRRLQYMWYTQIAKEWGWSVKRVRNFYMEKYAVVMFYRDNINDAANTVDCIKSLKDQALLGQYKQLKLHFVESITTSSFSVKQNSEYLNQVERHAISKGVGLLIPDDLKDCR